MPVIAIIARETKQDGQSSWVASAIARSQHSALHWERRPTRHGAILAVAAAVASRGHPITQGAKACVERAGEQLLAERIALARSA